MIEIIEEVKTESSLSVLAEMMNMDHEEVLFCQDKECGLKAIIAIHSTTLGPSLGGTRMWNYRSEAEALKDVLRLSRGMTYKSSLAGLDLGGGKAVIIGDPRKEKNEFLFRRFGQFVQSLSGRYITAEDVGITTRDIEWVGLETEHVAGTSKIKGGSGDPSPLTALGVYMGIKAAVNYLKGSDDLEGMKIAVQGVGHVGEYLVKLLAKENADITITDIYADRINEVSKKYKTKAVEPEHIYEVEMDIYAPCALGSSVNPGSLERMNCDIIAGAANNQLENEKREGKYLLDNNIIYVPDYLINAGGIINCFSEFHTGGYDKKWSKSKTEDIYNTTTNVLKRARDEQRPTYEIANILAEERLAKAAYIKSTV